MSGKALARTSLLTMSVLVAACGGGSGDDGPSTSMAPDTSAPADAVATEVLQRSAARNSSESVTANLAGVQSMVTGMLSTINSMDGAGSSADGGSNKGLPFDDDTMASIEIADAGADVSRLVEATLGVDESGEASVTRQGNRILIDPDDAAVCGGGDASVGMSMDFVDCRELVSHLTVQIDAVTEQSGRLSYLFDDQALLVVDYAPNGAAFELDLSGLRLALSTAAEIDGGSAADLPDVLEGGVRLSATVRNDRAEREAGTLALEVTRALRIRDDSEQLSVSLEPSTLMRFDSDAGAGTARLEFSLGQLEASFVDDDSVSFEPTSISFGSLSGRIDMLDGGQRLVVSNLGLGSSPFQLSVGGEELINVSLPVFGFTVSEADGRLVLNEALDLSLMLSQGLFEDMLLDDESEILSIDARLQAPAGTVLEPDAAPGQSVVAGGPVNLNYSEVTTGGSQNGFVTWRVGSCEDSSNQQGASETLFPISCD